MQEGCAGCLSECLASVLSWKYRIIQNSFKTPSPKYELNFDHLTMIAWVEKLDVKEDISADINWYSSLVRRHSAHLRENNNKSFTFTLATIFNLPVTLSKHYHLPLWPPLANWPECSQVLPFSGRILPPLHKTVFSLVDRDWQSNSAQSNTTLTISPSLFQKS